MPKDLLQLSQTLGNVPAIKNILQQINEPALGNLVAGLDPIPELHALISSAIDPEAQGPSQMETSSVRALTKRWISTVWSCVREQVGLWRLRPRSVKRLVSTILRLITTKRRLLFPCDQFQSGQRAGPFFRKATLKTRSAMERKSWLRSKGRCWRRVISLLIWSTRFSCGFAKRLRSTSVACRSWLGPLQPSMFCRPLQLYGTATFGLSTLYRSKRTNH